MQEEHYTAIIKGLQRIEIQQAVTNTKLENLEEKQEETKLNTQKLDKRVDNHDKIVGAIALSVAILGALVRFKIL